MNTIGSPTTKYRGEAWMDLYVWAVSIAPGLVAKVQPLMLPISELVTSINLPLGSYLNEPGRP